MKDYFQDLYKKLSKNISETQKNFPLITGALNEELLETSYNELEIYQD